MMQTKVSKVMRNNDLITPIPETPEGLKATFHRRSIVPFIGAGLFRLQGCPDWNSFANELLDELVCAFRSIPATDSDLIRPPVPVKTATHSDGKRSPIFNIMR